MGWSGSVHCTQYEGALSIGFWLTFWCAFIGTANCMRAVFMFRFVLESYKHQVGKTECLYACLVQQKTLQVLQGSANNKIPNIPYQTLLSDFSRVWLRDYSVGVMKSLRPLSLLKLKGTMTLRPCQHHPTYQITLPPLYALNLDQHPGYLDWWLNHTPSPIDSHVRSGL